MPISCFVASSYIFFSVAFFTYSMLIQDFEDKDDEWRSKAFVFFPAGVLGALFLVQIKSLIKSFDLTFTIESTSLLSRSSHHRLAYNGTNI